MVIMKDTVLADDNNAIVLIEETTKMFSLRSSEYNPIAYTEVMAILTANLAGNRK